VITFGFVYAQVTLTFLELLLHAKDRHVGSYYGAADIQYPNPL